MSLMAKNKGAVFVAIVANTASLLFGFDTGVAGSVVALQRSVRRNRPIQKYKQLLTILQFLQRIPILNQRPKSR
jgi:hypothetical protein